MPLRIEVSDREIKVIGSGREVVLPKDSLRAKAILDRLRIGRESEFSQEIYL
ncbi:MAG: pantothenate kinase [Thermocrinis sp.]|nr:pantothenate kinase [Thermocrinis sp.]